MAKVYATIVCRQTWWLKYYLVGVLVVSRMTGREPDMGCVSRWVEHVIEVEVR